MQEQQRNKEEMTLLPVKNEPIEVIEEEVTLEETNPDPEPEEQDSKARKDEHVEEENASRSEDNESVDQDNQDALDCKKKKNNKSTHLNTLIQTKKTLRPKIQVE